jgi:hypothetical protein
MFCDKSNNSRIPPYKVPTAIFLQSGDIAIAGDDQTERSFGVSIGKSL